MFHICFDAPCYTLPYGEQYSLCWISMKGCFSNIKEFAIACMKDEWEHDRDRGVLQTWEERKKLISTAPVSCDFFAEKWNYAMGSFLEYDTSVLCYESWLGAI